VGARRRRRHAAVPSGFAYQNYIDPELADWEHAYFGANLARPKAIKRRYDPTGRFAFPQGVSG
jgi:FAD/FMN-containing dehydrogenase